jgi:hypothetical protein
MKSVKDLLLTGLIALAAVITFSGCPTGDDDSSSSGETEKVTGIPAVEESGILLVPWEDLEVESVTIPSQPVPGMGDSWFQVTKGKLSFKLGTPDSLDSSMIGDVYELMFGPPAAGEVEISGSAKIKAFRAFHYYNDSISYYIERYHSETDNNYAKESFIYYIYVDKDCTLSRPARNWQDEERNYNYEAVDLRLKAGWNLVQLDVGGTLPLSNLTATAKIADKDVPWRLGN